MKFLKLNKGKVAVVDDEDFDRLSGFTWYVVYKHTTSYAARSEYLGVLPNGNPRVRRVYLHHDVVGKNPGGHVDHINRDGLDNQKENLRFVSPSKNQGNRKPNKNNTSGFVGVTWSKSKSCWVAQIMVDYKLNFLGHFDSPEEAARIRDSASKRAFGDCARLNFP